MTATRDRSSTPMAMGLFLKSLGHHLAAWRAPNVDASAHYDLAHFADIARIAERAKFDFLFSADFYARSGTDDPEQWSRTMVMTRHEPLTMSTALAALTSKIGFVLTASTTFYEPMHIARLFLSLDQISGGRAGWNLVTSAAVAEAENFGLENVPSPAERYDRAEEFVDVVKGLWDGWEDDAFLGDVDRSLFLDKNKVHELRHAGKHFNVRGPVTAPRSPQGQPVIVQAGQSGPGRELAGRVAEVVFTVQQDIEEAKAYYKDVKEIAARYGRNPDHVKVMPGTSVMVAPTKAEAEDRFAALQKLIPVEVGVDQVSSFVGTDLSQYPVDGPFPEIDHVPAMGHGRMMYEVSRREGLTIRQAYERFSGQRGHRVVIGDPVSVADALEEWYVGGACDGYNIMPPTFPDDLNSFAELLVPELQRRGLMRKEYEGTTLRDHLGLPKPPNRWA